MALNPGASSKRQRLRKLVWNGHVLGFAVRGALVLGGAVALALLRGQLADATGSHGPNRLTITPQLGLFLASLPFVLAWLAYVLVDLVREYRPRDQADIEGANEFLHRVDTPYVLILRPFRWDGFVNVPCQRSLLSRLLTPVQRTLTVEQIIAQEAHRELGHLTCAVVDPHATELSPGPSYVSCPEDWQPPVEALIRGASAVFFVFPPHRGATDAVEWELRTALLVTDPSRLAAVLPPRADKRPETFAPVAELLQTWMGFVDAVTHAAVPDVNCVLVYAPHQGLIWSEVPGCRSWMSRVTDQTYRGGIRHMLRGLDHASM